MGFKRVLLALLIVTGGFASQGMCQRVPQGFRPLLITLDHNNDFVLTGDGQETGGIEFKGPDGAFELAPGARIEGTNGQQTAEGAAPDPFQFLITNTSSQIAMGILGQNAVFDGSYPLGFGPTDLSLLDDVFVQIGFGPIPVENPINFVCDDCTYPFVRMLPDGGIDVANINELIINLTLFSPDGITVTQLPAGVTVVEQSETQVTLEKLDGFDPANLLELDFVSASSTQPVFAEFTLANDVSFGPFPIAEAVPEPSSQCVALILLVCGGLCRRQYQREPNRATNKHPSSMFGTPWT